MRGDGYVLHSGRPYSLWFCVTGLLNDFVVRRGRDSHRLLMTNCALVGPHQPSLEKPDDAVDPRQ